MNKRLRMTADVIQVIRANSSRLNKRGDMNVLDLKTLIRIVSKRHIGLSNIEARGAQLVLHSFGVTSEVTHCKVGGVTWSYIWVSGLPDPSLGYRYGSRGVKTPLSA